MKILVTGGSGFLGTHIKAFFDADDMSRRSGLDILNLNDVRRVGEYDVVIHLAAEMSKAAESAGQVFLTNIEGTVNVLREVREGAAFIFASTKDVYGRFADNYREVPESCPTLYSGQSPLEWSKLIAERYVEYYAHTRKFRSCIFRLSTVYAPASEGNVSNFVTHYADAINRGEPILLPGGGRSRRDLLHVNDFATACRAFIDSAITHGLYNLGGGRMNVLSLSELIAKLDDVSGLQAVADEEHPLPNPIPLNYVSDIGLITRELDWNPTTPLEQGLRDLFHK